MFTSRSPLRRWFDPRSSLFSALLRGRNRRQQRRQLELPMAPAVQVLEDRLMLSVSRLSSEVNVSNAAGTQGEVGIAANPNNPLNLVTVANNNSDITRLGAWYSFDGGANWTASFIDENQDGFGGGDSRFDPNVHFDSDGNVYVVYSTTGTGNRLLVARSTDGGQNFNQVTTVTTDAGPNDLHTAMVTSRDDPNGADDIFVTWSRPQPGGESIEASLSLDAGATFSVTNSMVNDALQRTFLPWASVDNSGDFHISWEVNTFAPDGTGTIFHDVLDGTTLADGVDTAVTSVNITDFAAATSKIPAQPTRGLFSVTSLEVDRSGNGFDGRVYLAYSDRAIVATDDIDIFVRFSDDNGGTWSGPIQINDDATTTSQFMPRMVLDQVTGTLFAAWYDARNDTANNQVVDVYMSTSRNGGLAWSANHQLTEAVSNESATNPSANSNNYTEYFGMTAIGGYAFTAWTDARAANFTANLNEEVYVVGVQLLEPDEFEPNSVIEIATVLGSLPKITLRDLTIHDADDVDVYKITAQDTGKLIINAFFDDFDGDLNIRVLDMNGNNITPAGQGNSTTDNEKIVIPVVTQEMYFLEVVGMDGDHNAYELEIENFPAPVPSGIHLDPASDTGMMNNDNITADTTPTFWIQADLEDFVDMGIPILSSLGVAGGVAGAAVEVSLVNTTTGVTTTAYPVHVVGTNFTLWRLTASPALSDGVYFVRSAVRINDGQRDENGMVAGDFPATGRSQYSEPLWFTIDTGVPKGMVEEVFTAELTGAQEVGPVVTTASGNATLLLNPAGDRLEMTIELVGLDLDGNQTPGDPNDDVTGLHIHNAAFGFNGPVVFGLIGINSDLNGDLVIDAANGRVYSAWDIGEGFATTLAAQLANLRNGDLYVNVHTVGNMTGEIRGQIGPGIGTVRMVQSSDSGMSVIDNVTNKMSPAFTGWGEANAKVRVFATNVDTGAKNLVGEGVVGSDGTDGVLNNGKGIWEVTVEPLADAAYEITVEFEDLAGNISSAYSFVSGGGLLDDFAMPVNFFTQDVAHLPGNIMDIDVKLNITHRDVDQLDIFLFHPDGTAVELVTFAANGGRDFFNTSFDDEAAVSINAGTAPYFGRFQPEGSLSTLDGKDPSGEWSLRIIDNTPDGSFGLLNSWELCIKTDAGLPIVIDTEAPNTPHLDLVESDDTGMMNDDNITSVNAPMVTVTANDTVGGNGNPFPNDVKYRIYDRPGDGSGEVLLIDSFAAVPGFTTDGFFEHTLTSLLNDPNGPPLADGVHNLKLEVEDRAGNISHDFLLNLVIDTAVPAASLPDMLTSSDTGMDNQDNVTNKMSPAFQGSAEANAKIRVLADGVVIGQGVVGTEGSDGNPDNGLGHWEVTVEPLADAMYQITTEVEDLAGNISSGPPLVLSQITNTTGGGNFNPVINADGTRVAFQSSNDPLGTNADGNVEIFLFDTTSGLTQITNTTGVSNFNPSINADGTRIAFSSDGNPLGTNVDGNQEIFLFDTTSGLSQITNTTGGVNDVSSMNADGTRIAFASDRNFVGTNADGNLEIFLFDTTAISFSQITTTIVGTNRDPSINADGTRIAFQASSDPLGTNADNNIEIFLFDTTTGLTQITITTGGINITPSINADGTRIAFEATSNPLGTNADANREIFLFDTTTGLTQITNTTGGNNFKPSINANGTRIAFRSDRDLVGTNADLNNEIFLFDTTTGFTQITNTTGGFNAEPSINADGTRIAFRSDRDPLGTNADGNTEIFTADVPLKIYIDSTEPNTPFLDLITSDDTGMMNDDNITSVNTPTVTVTANDTVDGNGNPFPNDIKYRIYDRPGDGSGEVLLIDSFAAVPGFTEDGFFTHVLTSVLNDPNGAPLTDGVHNLKLEVEDRAGNISHDFLLNLVVDTTLPKGMVEQVFRAELTGDQEVGPVVTTAFGNAMLLLNPAQNRLEMTIELAGLDLGGLTADPLDSLTPDTSDDVTGLHIHNAPALMNGVIVFGLFMPDTDLEGPIVDVANGRIYSAWDFNEGFGTVLVAQLANLFAGELYFNVHTVGNPTGEIRGQIEAAGGAVRMVPSSDTGMSVIDNVTNKMSPAFTGWAEANAKVRVFATNVNTGSTSLVGQGVVGTDGTDGVLGNGKGVWEVTVEPLADGEYEIAVEYEDLAGNISSAYSFVANGGLPAAIPDDQNPHDFTQDVARLFGNVMDIDVKLDISHPDIDQLDIRLIAPDGTSIVLVATAANDGADFFGTIFDDEAAVSINAGTAPYTGRFQPEGVLATFDGKDPNGQWTLRITDETGGDAGELLGWELCIKTDAGLPIVIDTEAPNTPFLDLVDESDTGMMNDDNITADDTPDVTVTANDTVDGNGNPFPHDVKYRIYDRPGDGSGEVLLVDSYLGIPGFTEEGFFEHTLTSVLNDPNGPPLADGVHNLKLEVEDRAGNISHDFLLTIVIDTVVPKAMVEQVFRAELDGAQEFPSPVMTTAFGNAMLLLNPAQDRLEMTIELVGLDLDGMQTPGDPNDDVTALHIHNAPAGAVGGVVFGLINPDNDLNGDLIVDAANGRLYSAWDLNEGNGTTLAAQLANLLDGDLYVNVHTNGNPGGEIRGQILAAGGAVRLVPSSDTGMSVIDNVTNKMSPAFTGWAEANAKVRVFAKNLETGSVSLVGQGLVGSDGTDGVIGNNKGFWEVTVEPMADGAYEITIEHEDLAGNISSAYSFLGNGGLIVDDQQPNDFAQDVAHLFGNIMDIDVRIDIEHPEVDQLDIFLIHPDGTMVELVTDVANDGANFFGTVFDDEAAESINMGVASYKGRFRPEESLNDQWAFMDPNGQWRLRITDDTGGDVGILLGWELCIKTDAGLPIWIDTAVPNTPYLDLVETSDTGRHSADNITSDNTPTVTIVADDTIDGDGNPFWHDIKYRIYDRPGDGSGEVLIVDSYASIPGFSTLGFFTEVLSRELNNPNGLPLHDGVHNLKLEVEDRAGNISPDFLLQVVIDTHKPSTFFGLPELAYDGLDHSSDSDVDVDPDTNSDRVTNDTTPTFFGTAEADSIIKVYVVDGNGNQVLIGQTVAVPLDGNQAYPGGRWEVTSALDLNDPSLGFARDGLRQIEVVGEDVAGNISYGQADANFFSNFVVDLLPPNAVPIPNPGSQGFGLGLPTIAGRIIDVDVKLSITHTNVQDVDFRLTHNDTGTSVVLFNGVNLAAGANFINTVLDDEALTAITAGAASFTGSFIPENALSAFDGLDADSVWTIVVTDTTANGDEGFVFPYELAVCVKLSPLEIFLDTQGPRVYDPDAGGPDQPIQVISEGVLDPEFNIFDIKPTTGPTPRVDGLKINIEDLPPRFVNSSPEFLATGAVTDATNATPIVITSVDHALQTGDLVEISGVTGNTAANGLFSIVKLTDNTFELVGSAGNGAYVAGGMWTTRAFPYRAIANNLALEGHIVITGDRVGNVAFKSITFVPDPDPPLHGESAKGCIKIEFYEPLEDDRFTLMIMDSVVDPANNAFDGESNAQEPFDNPLFPSGDGIAGGNFVSRFTVDTRDEIAVFGQAGVFIDANGNYVFNPPINGGVNHDVVRDLVFDVGIQTDHIFAGEFKAPNAVSVNGYDRIGAYGKIGGVFRFLLDIDDDGVVDLNFASNLQINALPVAGNFDGNAANGDEIGLFDGFKWYFDTTGNNVLDTTVTGNLAGLPIVGDFDGDGIEDLGTHDAGIDLFRLSLSSQGGGFTNALTTTTFIFGFPGVNERPAAGQLDADAADDIALTVPDQNGAVGQKEWYILITGDPKRELRDDQQEVDAAFNAGLYQQFINNLIDPFSPTPVGDDYFTIFGDNQSVPIIGNFDPPTGEEEGGETGTTETMAETAYSLDQNLGLVANSTYNWGGAKEKWLGSASGAWYFITEDGKLYKWTGSKPGAGFVSGSQLVATFDANYYLDPTMLSDAQEPASGGGGGEEEGGDGGGTGEVDPLAQAAYDLDQSLGLEANATYNWGGAKEKWLGSASGEWYFITEDGKLYKWTGSSPGAGFVSGSQLVATLDPSYYADPSTLTEAPVPTAGGGGEEGGGEVDPLVQAAYDLDQSLGLVENATYNWGGAKEKWLGSASGAWYFITENGSLYKWTGSSPGAEFVSGSQLVATFDPSYYADPSKLFDAKLLDEVFTDPDGLLV